jgi:hypothetical protein
MRRPQAIVHESRSLIEIFDEAIEVIRQDLTEYAFIALLGAAPACIFILLAAVVGGPVALSLTAPVIVFMALATLAASAAAFNCVTANLQPDAQGAYLAALRRAVPLLLPWLPLMIGLWAASYAAAAFSSEINEWYVPDVAVVAALVVACGFYIFPRSLCASLQFVDQMSSGQSQAASAIIVRAAPKRVWATWGVCAAPALLIFGLGMIGGWDAVLGAIMVLFFIATLPFAGAVFSLLFVDAASSIDFAPQERQIRRTSTAQRRA